MENDLPTAGRFEGRKHILPVRVYYEDTDFTGVVYHANYVRYFERGRSDFLRMVGVGHAELADGDSPTAFVVTRMEIDFRRPARIDDALRVVTTYDEVRGPRLFVSQRIFRGEELIAAARVEAACITMSGRPCKPPAGMAAMIKPFLREG
jgi:acyl-CoA thioester hydrolase